MVAKLGKISRPFLILTIVLAIGGFFIFSSASLGVLARDEIKFSNVAFNQLFYGLFLGSIACLFFSTGRIFENCFYSVFCCLAFWIEEQGCYLLLGSFAFFDLLSNIRTDTVGTARHRHFRSYYFCCFGNVYCRWGKVATCFGYIICWSSSLGHTLFYKTLHKTED